MKKAFTILVILCTIGLVNLKAQETVATLSHQGTTTIFYGINAFVDAYNASASGDTVYLSAGHFNAPSQQFTIGIKIFGAGCWQGTGLLPTTIDNLYLASGSDGFALEGVNCNNFQTPWGGTVSGISFTRCKIGNLSFNSGSFSQVIIENCILYASNFSGVSSGIIRNNIFHYHGCGSFITGAFGMSIENNTFIWKTQYVNCGYNYRPILNIEGCYLKNNIFDISSNNYLLSGNNNTFTNNLFIGNDDAYFNATFPTNAFTNNYNMQTEDSLFVSLATDPDNFSFSNDYHLQYPLLHLGTDSTQLGMYGGTTPFREKAIPCNPQITKKVISNHTNPDGTLPVDIEAKAQKY